MRLVPNSKLYGRPAVHIRDFLLHIGPDTFNQVYLKERLQLSDQETNTVLSGLLADNYVVDALPIDDLPGYGLAPRGLQLAVSTFAYKIKREVGEQLLAGVISRASNAEAQRPFVFQVTKIALFGSMLTDSALVHDVDLAIAVETPYDGAAFDEAQQRRIDAATKSGKRFRSMLASVVWPRMELTEYLRGGSRHISLHSFNELELMQCPYRVVFEKKLSV